MNPVYVNIELGIFSEGYISTKIYQIHIAPHCKEISKGKEVDYIFYHHSLLISEHRSLKFKRKKCVPNNVQHESQYQLAWLYTAEDTECYICRLLKSRILEQCILQNAQCDYFNSIEKNQLTKVIYRLRFSVQSIFSHIFNF